MRKLLLFLILTVSTIYCKDIYSGMNLEELFEMEIVETATKSPEDLFETPLSVTIIKQKEIQQSCATSIPEVLRMVPGLIVREITSGNYDVHIRGFDDITTNYIFPLPVNTTILVMIDGRIVYDYFSGGTFWESLPVTLEEVQRIEVVRGPAAALYGPNAMLGVVNIITNKTEKPGLSSKGTVQFSNEKDVYLSTILNYNRNNIYSTTSLHYCEKPRKDKLYYSMFDTTYVSYDQLEQVMENFYYNGYSFSNIEAPDVRLGLQKIGMTSKLIWEPHLFKKFELSSGFQHSESQKFFFQNFVTPYSAFENIHSFFDVEGKIRNTKLKTYFQFGERNCDYWWFSYRYKILTSSLEHDFDTVLEDMFLE